MERYFKRHVDSLPEVFQFVGEFFTRERIDQKHLYAVNFAAEEVFTNLVKYNPGTTNDILLRLERSDAELVMSLTDFDVEEFDINQAPDARTDLPIEQRRPGGLGIHLVRKLIDRIDYEYVDRRSTTTLVKRLG